MSTNEERIAELTEAVRQLRADKEGWRTAVTEDIEEVMSQLRAIEAQASATNQRTQNIEDKLEQILNRIGDR